MCDLKWLPLDEWMPNGEDPVLLFNPKHLADAKFVGHPVIVSNVEYAVNNAHKDGYTHWCEILPYPVPDDFIPQGSAR